MKKQKLTAIRWVAFLWLVTVISGCDSRNGPLTDIDGRPIEVNGRVLLVNYWAEWCKPCRTEIPELNQFASEAADKVLVLGVNHDQPPAGHSRIQIKRLGIGFPVLGADPAARWGQARPAMLPSTLVIDRHGRWHATLVGPQTAEKLHTVLEPLLDSESGPSE